MRFQSLRNIRHFFQWLAEIFRTWFTPYHYDEDVENSPEAKKGAGGGSAETKRASGGDSTPRKTPDETESYASSAKLSKLMAFRGAVSKAALASIAGKTRDEVDREIERLIEANTVEELEDGRYLLGDGERRHVLRSDYRMTEWLSGLQTSDFENEILDVAEQLCRQLSLKITVGKSLVFHLRQQKWMVWQSREETCRVRLFGTLTREQWMRLREIDHRARRNRREDSRRWDSHDWATFRWRFGADTLAIESVLLESGREFQKRVRRRRGSGKHRAAAAPANASKAK